MSRAKKKEETTASPPTPPRWRGADSLGLVYQLNERALTLLKQTAGHRGKLWVPLDEEALRRAAHFPFVIVDVYFADEAWWRSVITHPDVVMEGPPAGPWPMDVATRLMSEVLIFAWHTAKWDRRVARLTLGMVPEVAEIIRRLTPQQLHAIAGLRGAALHLRWQDAQEFWTRLTQAARDDEKQTLADIHLHAKLLFAGELMARSTGRSVFVSP